MSRSGEREIDLLLDMAINEFAEKGFASLSMRDLARRCGITTGAIYHHFHSKEELYSEACRRKFDDIAYQIDQRIKAEDTAEDKLRAFITTLFDKWMDDKALLLLTERDVLNALSNPPQSLADSHYRKLMDIAKHQLADFFGDNRDDDFYFTFGAMLYGYCSLMSHDINYSQQNRDDYLSRRKNALLKHCMLFLDAARDTTPHN